jgi:Xaa-Pro aminopeptidase
MSELGIRDKVEAALAGSEYDAVLATGADNVQYLSGAALPFLPYRPDLRLMAVWPKDGAPVLLCPPVLESTVRELGWIERVQTYPPGGDDPASAVAAVAEVIGRPTEGQFALGIDTRRMPCDFFEALHRALPEARLLACDEWLRDLRMNKTGPESALLEEVAYTTDHGINGSLHHVIVASPRTQLSEVEQIRVHCLERGLVETGYHSVAQVTGGSAARKLWPLCPRHGFNYGYSSTERLQPGQMVRLSMRATRDGYWSDGGRILVMGQPSGEQAAAYQNLVMLREVLMAGIRPGVACSAVFQAAVDAAGAEGIDFVRGLGAGQGIGVTTEEAPYLAADDDTKLQPGMVLVLAPVVRGPESELLYSKDTVVVTKTGCRLVGWWKDWREPYIPIEII